MKLIEDGTAEGVPNPGIRSDITWYLPSVVKEEPHKDKPRFCLDARAETHGVSLNSLLMSGDGTMVTVFNALQNARRFDFFAVGDIKAFFHRVALLDEDKDALRFFRWTPGQEEQLECLRMITTPFGLACSSTNSTYALRKNAEDHGDEFPPEVIEAIYREAH